MIHLYHGLSEGYLHPPDERLTTIGARLMRLLRCLVTALYRRCRIGERAQAKGGVFLALALLCDGDRRPSHGPSEVSQALPARETCQCGRECLPSEQRFAVQAVVRVEHH